MISDFAVRCFNDKNKIFRNEGDSYGVVRNLNVFSINRTLYRAIKSINIAVHLQAITYYVQLPTNSLLSSTK